jgi:NAD-dependent deacetylase
LEILSEVIKKLNSSKSVVFFTGAGVSAESGIPIFRGKDGIWNKLKPEELANINAFLRNPDLVWEWYQHRRRIVEEARPNPAHLAIARMEMLLNNVIVVTQNIDNLHKRAGSKVVYELHGNIERNYCIKCHTYYNEKLDFSDQAPRCKCGGLIRPDVVWFGEFLPEDQFAAAEKAVWECDTFVVVGTSAIVFPAASLIYTAKKNNACIVEINIEPTEITTLADASIIGKAGEVLPEILAQLKKNGN